MTMRTPGAALLLGGHCLVAVGAESMPSMASLDMAVPPAFAQACFEADTDLWGADLAPPIMESSAENCQVHCQQVAGCQFFSWQTEGGKCYVKSAGTGRQGSAGTTSGPRSCQDASARPDPSFQQMGLAQGGASSPSAGGSRPQWVDVPVTLPAGGGSSAVWPGGGGGLESMPPFEPETSLPPVVPVVTTTWPQILPEVQTSTVLPVTTTMWEPGILTPEPQPTFTPAATTTVFIPDIVPETTTLAPIETTATIPDTIDPNDDPLMTCELNCYGESATPVPIGDGSADAGVNVDSIEHCRQLCIEAPDCEAVVFHDDGMCWGKKDANTYRCPHGEGGFRTDFVTQLPFGTCAILGDPHILTFDNARGHIEDNTELHHGHYHLVDSPALQIQGRFGYTHQFPSASSLVGVAAGGAYVKGNHLAVVYRGPEDTNGVDGFVATWNGQEILQGGLGSTFRSPDGVLTAECNLMDPQKFHESGRHTYGGDPSSGDKPSYLFKIEPELEIYLLLGDDAMNAVITMRALPGGQDGWCGNFNCDAEDDTLVKLTERVMQGDLGVDSLFAKAAEAPYYQTHPAGPVPSLETCDPAVLREAETICVNEGRMKNSCMLDECAKVVPLQDKMEAGNGLALHGAATFVPGWLQASLGVALMGLFVLGVTVASHGRRERQRHRLYDTLAVEEGVERDSSREFRGFAGDGAPGFFEAPLLGLRRLRSSAVQGWSRASLQPLSEETDEEALLSDGVAGEHEPILEDEGDVGL